MYSKRLVSSTRIPGVPLLQEMIVCFEIILLGAWFRN